MDVSERPTTKVAVLAVAAFVGHRFVRHNNGAVLGHLSIHARLLQPAVVSIRLTKLTSRSRRLLQETSS